MKVTHIALVIGLLCATRSVAEEYAGSVVAEPAVLAQELAAGSSDFVLLDVRPKPIYEAGHLPGAQLVDATVWKVAFDVDAPADRWARGFGELGIGSDTHVVVYDETLTPKAARVWWLLRYWGVERATVLNGGWCAWRETGGASDTETPAAITRPEPFDAGPRAQSMVGLGGLKLLLTRGEAPTLIDTRSLEEHSAGCLPGAKWLEWSALVDSGTGKLLPADQLRAKFETAGIDPATPTISYCRTGGRASVTILALAALGADDAVSYYGGWSDWSVAEPALPAEGVR